MQALAERLGAVVVGARLAGAEPLSIAGLKTVAPAPGDLVGDEVAAVERRGKYAVVRFASGRRILVHLGQAGRLDVESPPKRTRPKGAVARLTFEPPAGGAVALLVREFGTERRAAWWVLAAGDDGPLGRLGPEPESEAFAAFLSDSEDTRRVHTILRDQRTVAGVGRGYADDALHAARISPYSTLASLDAAARQRLLEAVRAVLARGLERERTRRGGLSERRLGEHFDVHGRFGSPCPRCGDDLARVSYEAYEITYCPRCQTGGRKLADRRLSRLLK